MFLIGAKGPTGGVVFRGISTIPVEEARRISPNPVRSRFPAQLVDGVEVVSERSVFPVKLGRREALPFKEDSDFATKLGSGRALRPLIEGRPKRDCRRNRRPTISVERACKSTASPGEDIHSCTTWFARAPPST